MGVWDVSFVALLCLSLTNCLDSKQPRVSTENGAIVGKYAISHYGKIYQSFEGIPYAKPPIDDRRFKEAQPLKGTWIGEWNATKPGSPCLQYDHFTRVKDENGDWIFSVIGDEDCLFLNVYTREGSSNKDVIFIIHGGAFMFGFGTLYGPEYIVDLDDVVVVTSNYRLGALGFLTTGDSISPGNNGLKDQTLALEWVQKNIGAFGGDPKKVTLVGLSAGGASVHYHFLSELSKGLFVRGYSFSGSSLCPWAFTTDGVEKTRKLAEYVGCPLTDSKTIIKCLRRRPARKIVEKSQHFQNWIYNPFTVFGPVMEIDSSRPFIVDKPRNLIKQKRIQDLPWIVSFTSEDGLYPAGDFVEDDRFLKQLNENWDAIAPSLLFYKEDSGQEKREPLSKIIREHYMGKDPISRETAVKLTKMLSDRLFIAPNVEAATLQAQVNKQPVYLYSYDYEGSTSTSQFLSHTNSTFGASHGDDFAYLVKFGGKDTHIYEDDKEMAKLLFKILHNYVKKGVPPNSIEWEPVSRRSEGKINYLRIKSVNDVRMGNDDNIGNVAYLKKLFGTASTGKDEL